MSKVKIYRNSIAIRVFGRKAIMAKQPYVQGEIAVRPTQLPQFLSFQRE